MKTTEQQVQTEFGKKVVSLLAEKGYHIVEPSDVAVFTDNTSDEAHIAVNCMSTGIHLPKSEVNKQDTEAAGFRWYPSWNWGDVK